MTPRPILVGLMVLAGSLLSFVAGQFGSELFLTRVSLIGVLAGLVLFLGGWRTCVSWRSPSRSWR